MEYFSAKDLSEMRKKVVKRKEEIITQMDNKKTFGKKQVEEWIQELCDLVVTYDPIYSSNSSSMQPFVKLVAIDSTDDWKTAAKTTALTNTSPLKENINENVFEIEDSDDNNNNLTEEVSIGDISPQKKSPQRVRFKGVIRGLDSLKTRGSHGNTSDVEYDNEWNPIESTSGSPPKKAKTGGRKTRGQTSKADKSTKKSDNESQSTTEWSSEGKVLGGDTTQEATELSAEEKRRLLAEKTEQRLAQMTTRGSKGVVRLPNRAEADRGDGPNALDNSSGLRWKM